MRLTRDIIVQTASAIADQEGLNKVTLKRIAQELGIRSPSLYNHINSLDDLWREIAHTGMKTMNYEMKESVLGKSGNTAVKATGAAYLTYMIAHPGIYEAIQWAVWHGTRETEQLFEVYTEFLKKLILSLDLKNGNIEEIVTVLTGVLHGYTTMQLGRSLRNPEQSLLDLQNTLEIVLLGIAEKYQ